MHDDTSQSDALLDRAVRAVLDERISNGPSEGLVAATLERLHGTDAAGPSSARFWPRAAGLLRRHRLAAAVLLPLPLLALLASLLLPGRHEEVVLGAVLKHIRSAQTLQFRVTCTQDGIPLPGYRLLVKGEGMRMENGPFAVILRSNDPRIVALLLSEKQGMVTTRPSNKPLNMSEVWFISLFEKVRSLSDVPGAYRGRRMLDGRGVLEFHTREQDQPVTILADEHTLRPVRVDYELTFIQATVTFSGFVYDAELPDELFSLELPIGYTLMPTLKQLRSASSGPIQFSNEPTSRPTVSLAAPTQADLLTWLRSLAEENGGVFPTQERLSEMTMAWSDRLSEARKQDSSGDKQAGREYLAYTMRQMRASSYLRSVNSGQMLLLGGEVKLGDASKPVFMWGMADQRHISVVYGDLSVCELEEGSPEYKAIVKTPLVHGQPGPSAFRPRPANSRPAR